MSNTSYQNLLASVIDTMLSGAALTPKVMELDGVDRALGIMIMTSSKEKGEVIIILNVGSCRKSWGC